MKFGLSIFLMFSYFLMSNAQVTSVGYELVHNKSTNQFDFYLLIKEGKTTKTIDRIQFNSQISFLVPTLSKVSLAKSYMPLQDNQTFKGTLPIEWFMDKPLISPVAAPEFDFYSVTPELIPTSLYNDIKKGDRIKLFSLDIETNDKSKVRLYKLSDPDERANGMKGRNFSNSFCLGSINQIFSY